MTKLTAYLRRFWPASTPAEPPSRYLVGAEAPMLRLNGYDDHLRARDFFEGVQIFGGTGSGKSSGSGKALAQAMLQAGWGGLVLCAKPDEAQRWVNYLHAVGRSGDLVLMRPGNGVTFNFVDYEVHRPDGHGVETYNLVALMEVMMDAYAQSLQQGGSDEGASFWIASRRELLANAIEPLVAATGRFRLDELMRMVTSAPNNRIEARSDEWKSQSYCYWVLSQSYDAPIGAKLPIHAIRAAADYWFATFADLDNKTRSNIVATLTSAISPFLRGVLHETFCTGTAVIPELAHEGAVIVLDFPVKTLGPSAAVAAQIMKYQWQKATERRAIEAATRPTFLYADECQFFLSKYDAEFQSTARSSRAATVYLTQNLPTYFAQLPGRDPRSAAESLLGNFQTKIFHANTDAATNNYAADLIGKAPQRRASQNWSVNAGEQTSVGSGTSWSDQHGTSTGRNWGSNTSYGATTGAHGQSSGTSSSGNSRGRQTGTSQSWSHGGSHTTGSSSSQGTSEGGGWSEQVDHIVPPVAFAAHLRKGGQSDDLLVDAVIVQGGRRFASSGMHWLHTVFHQ